MSVFTWTADFGATQQSKPNVSQVKFGDGYEQRVAFGLNTNPKTWSLRFSARDDDETVEIIDFLEARGGVESFEWTPPLENEASMFVCRNWSRTIDRNNLNTVTATFEQVFEP